MTIRSEIHKANADHAVAWGSTTAWDIYRNKFCIRSSAYKAAVKLKEAHPDCHVFGVLGRIGRTGHSASDIVLLVTKQDHIDRCGRDYWQFF